MDRSKEIEILIADGCTGAEAKRHLLNGTVVYDDFEENLEAYIDDVENPEDYRKMVRTKIPMQDWGIVEMQGKTYYIMYVL